MAELRDLRAFVEVADKLSFTRAAESLHMRQQTVSKIIRDLERELGVELFERSTREVRVTAAGVALLEGGRRALLQAEVAYDAARAVGDGEADTIRVGTTPPVGITDRADVVAALRRDDADRSIAFHDVRPEDVHHRLITREVDFILARVSGAADRRLDHADLRRTPMVVGMLATHPLAGRARLRLSELSDQRLFTPSAPSSPYSSLLLSSLREGGATVTPVEAHVTGGAILLAELDDDDAIAIMPAGTECPDGVISVAIADFTLPLLVIWPAGRPPKALDRLKEQMRTGNSRASRTRRRL